MQSIKQFVAQRGNHTERSRKHFALPFQKIQQQQQQKLHLCFWDRQKWHSQGIILWWNRSREWVKHNTCLLTLLYTKWPLIKMIRKVCAANQRLDTVAHLEDLLQPFLLIPWRDGIMYAIRSRFLWRHVTHNSGQ